MCKRAARTRETVSDLHALVVDPFGFFKPYLSAPQGRGRHRRLVRWLGVAIFVSLLSPWSTITTMAAMIYYTAGSFDLKLASVVHLLFSVTAPQRWSQLYLRELQQLLCLFGATVAMCCKCEQRWRMICSAHCGNVLGFRPPPKRNKHTIAFIHQSYTLASS